MRVASGETMAIAISSNAFENNVCIQTCKPAAQTRLTVFCHARKIIRIRTKLASCMTPDATAADKIRCDACPVMCYIKPGAAG
ncbi:MAG: hypothetical protein WBF12_13535, partial [Bradyrhizobium sp.]